MNYEDRDTYGMYQTKPGISPGPDPVRGPGPALMGANSNCRYNVK